MMKSTTSQEELLGSNETVVKDSIPDLTDSSERPLTTQEKTFLLHADRGDCATIRKLIEEFHPHRKDELDINCVDPLNRSALIAAIENENIELIKILLNAKIAVKDALLHAIKEEYVEAVEVLLYWEEENHVAGEPYSWEAIERSASTFTADITPLILAAHRNHYEILKILLDRGATLPIPHDVRCGCDECVQSSSQDSLRHSQARINAYRALTSPSLIALSSKDPLLTAFELSWEVRRLSKMETEFREEYRELRAQCQQFATSLLDHARTSTELEIMLNYNPIEIECWEPGERQTLERLKLAIKYKQKQFVAHPNVQQLLGAIWYEGLPGFRRKSMAGQMIQVAKFGMMFPVYSTIYMVAPNSEMGKFMKKPFVKFICHSSSYMVFLTLLGLASQRAEYLVLEFFGTPWMLGILESWKRKERGAIPGLIEFSVILFVISLIWAEIKSLWSTGLLDYVSDLWNIVDFITNMFYITWVCMRLSSWYIVQRDYGRGIDPWYPREHWDPYDPMLLSEGAFAAGMIFSFLKLVHIFSINPHLGPLQVSLGRMIIDIIKFFFIYTLVLFAFGCGLNQLMWYYADLEKNKCYHLPSGLPDFDTQEKACSIWRRYANLFETSQSLFWASFGLVDLMTFDLTGIKSFTRFWALLMFGSYSVINVIVLLNMLIAMMSNSYQIISERSDMEWKFARSTLWISYFDDGDTLPPPFNLMPTPKVITKWLTPKQKSSQSIIKKGREKASVRHEQVMRVLVRRYVTAEQRKRDEVGVTEDDVMEIRQDISTLRYELIDILRTNGMKTPNVDPNDSTVAGKKGRVMERRLLKDFQIGIVEGIVKNVMSTDVQPKDVFGHIAKAIGKRTSVKAKAKDWNAIVRSSIRSDPIGSRTESISRERHSLRRHILQDLNKSSFDQDKLIEYNPNLTDVSQTTRKAYAKFMKPKMLSDIAEYDEVRKSQTSLRSAAAATLTLENEVFESPQKTKDRAGSIALPRPKSKKISSVSDLAPAQEHDSSKDLPVMSPEASDRELFDGDSLPDGGLITTDAIVETEEVERITSEIPEESTQTRSGSIKSGQADDGKLKRGSSKSSPSSSTPTPVVTSADTVSSEATPKISISADQDTQASSSTTVQPPQTSESLTSPPPVSSSSSPLPEPAAPKDSAPVPKPTTGKKSAYKYTGQTGGGWL